MTIGLPPEKTRDWDEPLLQKGGGILQGFPWAKFQQALKREVVWDVGDGWQWTAVVRRSRGLKYLMCSYGPVASSETAMRAAMTALVEAGIKLGVDFVRVEPQRHIVPADLEAMGARAVAEVQPTHTQVIDLTVSEEELRGHLASGHRNLINGTERRGITFRRPKAQEGIGLLVDMLADTAARSKVTFFPESYYRTIVDNLPSVTALYLAEVEKRPVASALFYDWGGTRYYAHAGAYQEANRQAKASVSLVWQAIMDAKAVGMTHFDLWGVAPSDDPHHPWAGLSKFKRGFGGHAVNYVGTWDIPIKATKYRLYGMYRRLRGLR